MRFLSCSGKSVLAWIYAILTLIAVSSLTISSLAIQISKSLLIQIQLYQVLHNSIRPYQPVIHRQNSKNHMQWMSSPSITITLFAYSLLSSPMQFPHGIPKGCLFHAPIAKLLFRVLKNLVDFPIHSKVFHRAIYKLPKLIKFTLRKNWIKNMGIAPLHHDIVLHDL